MRLKNREISLWLFIAKVFKVVLIRLAFLWPTLISKLLLRGYGCHYGTGLRVCGKVYFRPNGKNSITLGDHVTLIARFLTNPLGNQPAMLECIGSGSISIGNDSGLTSAIISSRSKITIGNNVNIGGNVRIFDHDFHALEHQYRRKADEDFDHVRSSEIIIEDDVFIGTQAIILKGVHIGARSVIGAGSVVTLNQIPPGSLVAGNPAKIVKIKLD